MIYAVSIRCEIQAQGPLSEDILYTVEFISDIPVTKDTIQVRTLVPIKDMPVPTFGADYIFAQTVTLHVHKPVQAYKAFNDVFPIEELIPGIQEERITVTGPLVRNKVEALAKGYYGRIDEKADR